MYVQWNIEYLEIWENLEKLESRKGSEKYREVYKKWERTYGNAMKQVR